MSSTIRVPGKIIDKVNRLVRASRRLLLEIGREPTPQELAERLAMPVDKVRKLMVIARLPIRLPAA